MGLIKKPVTGMKDILPSEMEVREYVIRVIKETYKKFGFQTIETPSVEHIENLNSKQGGENEKLIFKILKRGEKLNLEQAESETDLIDSGLRYDLTVPLVRYYSNNSSKLSTPFKALQIGSVWRADNPQKGRYRQFYQCDIDILGEASNLAEIELILATTATLGKLGFSGFEIRINDRRILKAMASYSGFEESCYDRVFIILDKLDKIKLEGVEAELLESGFSKESVEKYLTLLRGLEHAENPLEFLTETLGTELEDSVTEHLKEIIDSVSQTKTADFKMIWDVSLVRGMSYYTGTIFEIAIPQFHASCGGGGRYDKMIGQFTGTDLPACGFSIGFERIIMLLMEQGFQVPQTEKKVTFLIEKGIAGEELCKIITDAQKERESGAQVSLMRMNKNKKFQIEQLEKEGYTEFKKFFKDSFKL